MENGMQHDKKTAVGFRVCRFMDGLSSDCTGFTG